MNDTCSNLPRNLTKAAKNYERSFVSEDQAYRSGPGGDAVRRIARKKEAVDSLSRSKEYAEEIKIHAAGITKELSA